jgi:hypothetical protein
VHGSEALEAGFVHPIGGVSYAGFLHGCPPENASAALAGLSLSHADVGVARKTDLEKNHETAPAGPRGVLVPGRPDAKPFDAASAAISTLQRNKPASGLNKLR